MVGIDHVVVQLSVVANGYVSFWERINCAHDEKMCGNNSGASEIIN